MNKTEETRASTSAALPRADAAGAAALPTSVSVSVCGHPLTHSSLGPQARVAVARKPCAASAILSFSILLISRCRVQSASRIDGRHCTTSQSISGACRMVGRLWCDLPFSCLLLTTVSGCSGWDRVSWFHAGSCLGSDPSWDSVAGAPPVATSMFVVKHASASATHTRYAHGLLSLTRGRRRLAHGNTFLSRLWSPSVFLNLV